MNEQLEQHRRFLWGLCYRMTGSSADAEDLVQETFVRALEHPPADTAKPWRPWLVRVAMNLARDQLRRRRRAPYVGEWLPAPIDTGEEASPPAHEPLSDEGTPAARYDLLESVSFAFLLALEVLTPQQRAVLILRDVFDYSVRETADALDISEPNVKTSHHRARAAMREYDLTRLRPTRSVQNRAAETLRRFLRCLGEGDVAGLEALLAEDVRSLSDGGGEFLAALRPVIGRDRVIRLFKAISSKYGTRLESRMLNGLPAAVIDIAIPAKSRLPIAPRLTLSCDIGPDGRISRIYSVIATRKLTALREQPRDAVATR